MVGRLGPLGPWDSVTLTPHFRPQWPELGFYARAQNRVKDLRFHCRPGQVLSGSGGTLNEAPNKESPGLVPGFSKAPGSGLFSQRAAPPVSSALERFTSVFGMGTGGATPL